MNKKLSKVKRQRLSKLADELAVTFSWKDSRVGLLYWWGVYDELKRIGRTGEP